MISKLTKVQAKSYKRRWKKVDAKMISELRATSISQKLGQLASLMSDVDVMGWNKLLQNEEKVVRDRWSKLLRIFHAQKSKLDQNHGKQP